MEDGDWITSAPTAALLRAYGRILSELRARDVLRSENSPVGDYAEYLVATAFGLEREGNSAAGWDARDPGSGVGYQVKGRRLATPATARQLSALRGLMNEPPPFDALIAVLFDPDLLVWRAALIPLQVVRDRARPTPHVNGHRFMLQDSVWDLAGVQDVTERLRAVEAVV